MDQQNPSSKIRFQYVYPEDYQPAPVNGVHGGVTPRGEVVLHFYHERPMLPKVIEHEVTEQGRLGPMVVSQEDLGKPQFLRVVTGGAVMTIKSAVELRDWLSRQIEHAQSGAMSSQMPSDADPKQ